MIREPHLIRVTLKDGGRRVFRSPDATSARLDAIGHRKSPGVVNVSHEPVGVTS